MYSSVTTKGIGTTMRLVARSYVEEAGGKVNDFNKFQINNIDIKAASTNIYSKMIEKLDNF